MRTKQTIRNIITAWMGQIVILLCHFVSRAVMVSVLPDEYLGINGLFSNILAVLSMADLGLGLSMAYYLYEPIANDDKDTLCQILTFFKKIYIVISAVVFVIGCVLIPFLDVFAKDGMNIPYIRLIFFMYVLNSAVSYLNVYKAVLINANQQQHIVTSYTNIIKVIQAVVGILVLWISQSYIFYYALQIFATMILNFLISKKADKLYPYIKNKNIQPITKILREKIKKNTVAMFFHKFGSIVVNSTDNILMSKFFGVIAVGFYSNYMLIVTNLNSLLVQMFSAMTASVGNFNAIESVEKKKDLFYEIFFLNFAVYNFCSICLLSLLDPFICLWLGEKYTLDFEIVLVIVLNFYLAGMRKGVQIFKDASGLFRNDRFKALAESIVNLVLSLVLLKRFGMIGILLGTTISTVTACLWVEPLIVFKYVFNCSVKEYFIKYLRYFMETAICTTGAYFMCLLLPNGIGFFFVRISICGVIFFLDMLLYIRTKEFKRLFAKIRQLKGTLVKKI